MPKTEEHTLHDKFEQLNEQMEHLAAILDIMAEKMTRIEQATVQMHKDMREEMDELRDDLDFDQHDEDQDWKT